MSDDEYLRLMASRQAVANQHAFGAQLAQAQVIQGQSLANIMGLGGGLGAIGAAQGGSFPHPTQNFPPEFDRGVPPPKKKTGREELQIFISEWVKDINYD